MAERIAKVGTPQETLNKFGKELAQKGFLSKYIADRDTASFANGLIEAGMMKEGDCLVTQFVPNRKVIFENLVRTVKIYVGRRALSGKIIPVSYIGEYMLDIDFDNNN